MQSFKEYLLKEGSWKDNFEFWPRRDILDWVAKNGHRVLKKYNISDFQIGAIAEGWPDANGIVNPRSVNLVDCAECLPKINETEFRHFPCQFGKVDGSFFVVRCDLGSLKGSPKIVGGRYSISNNYAITSIEYLPEQAGSYILRNTSIKSFSGINKVIKRVTSTSEGFIMLPSSTESALLGFLKIPGLQELRLSTVVQHQGKAVSKELITAVNIVNSHLAATKDTIACQRELIENDLDEYAEF